MTRRADALLLEDFDIEEVAKNMPEKIIGVRVSRIYSQIAKISSNSARKNEFSILVEVLEHTCDDKKFEPIYVPMSIKDVSFCFKERLKKLPKSTFIEIY